MLQPRGFAAAPPFKAGVAPLLVSLEPATIARFSRIVVVLALSGLLRSFLYARLRRVGLMRLTLFIWVLFYAWFGYVFWDIV